VKRRLCDGWLRLVSPVVPHDARRDWLREWQAEIAFVAARSSRNGRGLPIGAVWRALGALPHAVWLRWDRWRSDMIAQDVKYAVRSLWKRPGFAAVTLLTLGIGIGANAAIFGAVRAVALRPLPFPDPDSVVTLSTTTTTRPGVPGGSSSAPDFLDWRRDSRSFSEMAASVAEASALTGDGPAEQVPNARVTGGFFNVLGVPALYGRTLQPDDDPINAENVAVLGHSLWTRRFNGQPGIVGTLVTIDGSPRRIVGVMPEGFSYPIRAELYLPLRFGEKDIIGQRGAQYLDVIARLKSGVTLMSAQSEMRTYARTLAVQYPRTNQNRTVTLFGVRDALVGSVRTAMFFLLGAVGFVLLIVCVNVANLFLTRALGRQREFALRAALGASRARLVRGLLVESIIVGGAGGAVGLLFAVWLTAIIAGLDQGLGIPLLDQTRVDGNVVVFTAGLSLVTAIMFGTLPALHTSAKLDLARRIREDALATTGDPHRERLRSTLVVLETAIAVVLLVGAGLLARSFAGLASVPLGFAADNVQTFSVSFPPPKYPSSASRTAFADALLDRAAALPQVESASAVFGLPLTDFSYAIAFASLDGRRLTREDARRPMVQVRVVAPKYFATMGVPLRRGRSLDTTDRAGAALAVVINETAAKEIWPDADPIGHEFSLGTPLGLQGPVAGGRVVGVVGDVRDFGPVTPSKPSVYLSFAQFPMNYLTVVLRTRGAPATVVEPARALLKDLDPDLPMFEVRSMTQLSSNVVAQPRLYLLLLVLFAGAAIMLAAIGTYGVISHTVSQRTREIGIRLALGAAPGQVVGSVVAQASALSLVGLVAGLLIAAAAGRFIQGLLFGVKPIDTVTYATVASGLAVVSLVASWVPARRASRIDPVAALKHE
jgi:putative ABC transport system permease protein